MIGNFNIFLYKLIIKGYLGCTCLRQHPNYKKLMTNNRYLSYDETGEFPGP